MPPPIAVAKDVSDTAPFEPTCPTPNNASANGRIFPTDTDRRGPKSTLYSCALMLTLGQGGPGHRIDIRFRSRRLR